MTAPRPTPRDIVGSWRAPDTEGIALGYYFYPDGVLILQDPRRKRFSMRGAWALDEDGHLVISDMVDPAANRTDEERELIRSERHTISITELSSDSMTWKPEETGEAGENIAFHREGDLPRRGEKHFWKLFLGGAFFDN